MSNVPFIASCVATCGMALVCGLCAAVYRRTQPELATFSVWFGAYCIAATWTIYAIRPLLRHLLN